MALPDPTSASETLVGSLEERLAADDQIGTPHDVIRTIDNLTQRLAILRYQAVQEHRRRTDEAISRANSAIASSGQMLGHVDPEVTR